MSIRSVPPHILRTERTYRSSSKTKLGSGGISSKPFRTTAPYFPSNADAAFGEKLVAAREERNKELQSIHNEDDEDDYMPNYLRGPIDISSIRETKIDAEYMKSLGGHHHSSDGSSSDEEDKYRGYRCSTPNMEDLFNSISSKGRKTLQINSMPTKTRRSKPIPVDPSIFLNSYMSGYEVAKTLQAKAEEGVVFIKKRNPNGDLACRPRSLTSSLTSSVTSSLTSSLTKSEPTSPRTCPRIKRREALNKPFGSDIIRQAREEKKSKRQESIKRRYEALHACGLISHNPFVPRPADIENDLSLKTSQDTIGHNSDFHAEASNSKAPFWENSDDYSFSEYDDSEYSESESDYDSIPESDSEDLFRSVDESSDSDNVFRCNFIS